MIRHELKVRVRYAETDQMRYVYYGHFAQYFEMGRTELIRSIGVTYRDLEDKHGLMLPVKELHINYKKPAGYDEELRVVSYLREKPAVRIRIEHEIYNEASMLITTGHVELVFVNMQSMRPCAAPEFFMTAIENHWRVEQT